MLHLGKRTKTEMLPIGKGKETNAAHEEKHLKAKKNETNAHKGKRTETKMLSIIKTNENHCRP